MCNIVPHKLVEIMCKTPLQKDEEDDHKGFELSNLTVISYDEGSADLFYYFYIHLFNDGKTHLANIKLVYHVAFSNTRNIYTNQYIHMTYIK